MRYESYFVRFDAVSAVDRVEYSHDLNIYPNPTDGVLHIDSNLTDVEIFDIMGRSVYRASSVTSVIDISTLNAGTYIFVANDGDNRVSTKLIKY
jgi:hypothetical protein